MPSRNCFFLIALFPAALIASYFIAPLLPIHIGWENGAIENMQVVLLFLGGLWALGMHRTTAVDRYRAFWLIIAPVWVIMAARELSWGAVFYAPIDFSVVSGPTFSSSIQLWYKPAVPFVVAAILAGCIWAFIKTRQVRTVGELWRGRGIPLVEICLFVVAMLASAAAEGQMGLNLDQLGKSGALNFEELAEFWGYFALILAQWRVARCMKLSASRQM